MPNPFYEPITYLGTTLSRRGSVPFGMYQSDLLIHLFILGQTGTGKSTLIKNMIMQDIAMGNGFALFDPHGDLAEVIKPHLPSNAIYWDIADPACPYGYNPLSFVREDYRPLVTSAIIEALKKQWADAWGVRMEHLLRNAVLALLSKQGSSLLDIVPLFTNKAFRSTILPHVTDEQVLHFWKEEYPKMNYKNTFDGVAPIANKLGAFLTHPLVKQALCKSEQPLRLRALMDEGQPLILNLSKGRLGGDISNLVGGLILSMLAQAAYSRVDTEEQNRRPFHIYVDEFATFTTGTIASMLSELRKFKVGLVLVGQHTSQIPSNTLESILGNVGTQAVFRLGANDAPLMARQLQINPEHLIGQPNYRMFIKLMVKGRQTKAFSAQTRI